ncbi:S9 family peptidase [Phenylobacterium aquaticum]|uniref:S9 family peptidase n=2 Tax=Phenylobacterium aquaticum TaxID=1763816 RepID=UPI0026EC8622|nr:S9 family peptidase [Phenylobacterium aquaticum]
MTMTGSAEAQKLTAARVYAAPDLSGPRARGVSLSPDGTLATYLKAKADDPRMTDLWAADVAGGEPRMLIDARALIPKDRELSEAEKSRRERQGVQTRGVVAYDWDDQGRFILVPVEGDLWLYSRADGQVSRLTNTTDDEIDAKVSPKGGFVSFVRSDNLYVLPAGGGAEKALTTDGSELKSWATAEFIAQEEMARQTGYWWSPDERRIALTHVDQTGVDVVERADIGPAGATIVSQRYPRVGRPNARVDLYIADVATGARIKVDLGADPDIYLARVNWARDGKTLYVQREARDQRRLDLLAVDVATGAAHLVLSEVSPHWIDLSDDFRALKDGGFLWSSERSGWNHLYLYGPGGKLVRQVTQGDWPVDAIQGVDETRGVVIFTANKDTATERRLYEVSYKAAGQPRALTKAGGWWTVKVAKAGGAFAGTYEDPATPPQTGVYRSDGTLVRWIEENRLAEGHPYYPYAPRLRTPSFGAIKASDGADLNWMMRTPPGFDPAQRYPVIVKVYGGPGSALVRKIWNDPADQLYLEAGFILFTLDNHGTPNRSVAFKTAIDRKLGTWEVADQIAGAKYLTSLPYVDPARIGITGWSYGGYMTLMLLTAPNTPFAAGVSGAPPTDWTLYDTHYTERYMGTPKDNAAGYAGSEVTARVDGLKPDSLLLMHGMADDNVTFDNSTRLMAALQAKAIAFETMLYPGLRHRAGWTQAHLKHRTEATLAFFARKLTPAPAP